MSSNCQTCMSCSHCAKVNIKKRVIKEDLTRITNDGQVIFGDGTKIVEASDDYEKILVCGLKDVEVSQDDTCNLYKNSEDAITADEKAEALSVLGCYDMSDANTDETFKRAVATAIASLGKIDTDAKYVNALELVAKLHARTLRLKDDRSRLEEAAVNNVFMEYGGISYSDIRKAEASVESENN